MINNIKFEIFSNLLP